ncbi:MAG: spermidine synthase, partial [Gemmataceae bacterium]
MRTGLFALTLFASAALSFTAQPMVGKVLLPLLGGTPAVWATCLVFFQAALLAGYLYAHRTAAAAPRRQARRHLLALLLPPAAFAAGVAWVGDPVPVAAGLLPGGEDYPFLPLLAVLTLAIGVPFATLAATAPLLMRWYGPGPRAYTLYAASNAGSLVGLLGYPLLVEPWLPLPAQQWAWAAGVVGCLALTGVCGLLASDAAPPVTQVPTLWSEWLGWAGLAALPSALLTSVSAVLTAEVAPVPLLWVVPLALYLISFIVVFAGWGERTHRAVWRGSVPLVLFVALVLVTRSADPFVLVSGLHLAAFTGVCLVCHGELVLRRPPAERLTAFTLALAAGGVAGGLAAGLAAPLVFCRVGFAEYPVALVLACLVRPRGVGPDDGFRPADLGWAVLVGLGTLGLVAAAARLLGPPEMSDPLSRLVRYGVKYGPPLAVAFALVWRRWRFALCLGAVFLAAAADDGPDGVTLYTERNFFGTVQVVRSRDGRFVQLVHGA